MCGIAGTFIFSGELPDRRMLQGMTLALNHRGPDDQGIYSSNFIGLCQARLAIIGIDKTGTAPLPNEDKSLWVTFNGEIYNFQELKEDLLRKGHLFISNTDTEVLVHLYEEYRESLLEKLNGMFAFVIWDSQKKEIFAARDRIGKKPFYYSINNNRFTFASEIKSLLKDTSIVVAPNLQAINSYLSLQYVPSPLTAFEGIQKLPAGHYIKCDSKGNLSVQEYWAPHFKETKIENYSTARSLVLNQLEDAVKLRMVSEVPIGAFLSGGIDSGLVVSLMAKNSSQRISTYSIGIDGFTDKNELPYAKLVSQEYNTIHNEFIVKPDLEEVIPSIVTHFDEPFADFSAIPTYFVSKLARQGVTVALSGDGGDESFAGYLLYGQMLKYERNKTLPSFIKDSILPLLSNGIRALPFNDYTSKVSRLLRTLSADLPEKFLITRSILKDEEKDFLYHNDLKKKLNYDYSIVEKAITWDTTVNPLDWMMKHDQANYLAQCLNVKVDMMSMANSVEVRSPFLDYRLIELAYSIPTEMKWKGESGKYILKDIAKDLLPTEVVNKPKTGFTIPIDQWFRKELSKMLKEVLLSEQSKNRKLFNYRSLNRIIDEHISGKRNWSNRLWALLSLELWFIKYIDK